MKKCIAFRAMGFSPNKWVPCGLVAADGSYFCKKHGDTVMGGVLGLWVAGLLEPSAVKDLKIRGDAVQKKKAPTGTNCRPTSLHE
jgi:hypothetical protein